MPNKVKPPFYGVSSAGILGNNRIYRNKMINVENTFDSEPFLFCGALCRRKDRVSDGGAGEDAQPWSQDPRVHPVFDGAQEAD